MTQRTSNKEWFKRLGNKRIRKALNAANDIPTNGGNTRMPHMHYGIGVPSTAKLFSHDHQELEEYFDDVEDCDEYWCHYPCYGFCECREEIYSVHKIDFVEWQESNDNRPPFNPPRIVNLTG